MFASCENITLPEGIQISPKDKNQTAHHLQNPLPDQPKAEHKKTPQLDQPEIEKVYKLPLKQKPIVKIPEATKPEQPPFSQDLLNAVKNWARIPKSVFPAKPVTCNLPVSLLAKTSSGQVIANSLIPAGSETQVLGIRGSTLVVAHLQNSKLRGEIDIDQTDFKQLLAYRFELNKKKRLELAKNAQAKKSDVVTPVKKATPSKTEQDVIPDPLDFGHGRFCICKECREKRLAMTGSLKTGFGIEP
jgi:hypothetical protein